LLTISRPDITGEEIIEYGTKDRFIKLPVTPYLKLLGVWDTINAPQVALINALNNPKYRFICAAFARRLGKTYISNIVGQLVMLMPGANVLIVSPNFSLSSISFELQRRFIKHFDLEIERDNLKDKIIELSNGSTVRMGSLSTIDSVVGRSYDLIIFDEAALGSDGKEAFEVSLRPTLDRTGAKAVFISTPRGKNNWFSEFYERGFSDRYPAWCSMHADWTENSRMLVSDIEEARATMTKAKFEQEYMASFLTYEGQIFAVEDHNIEDYIRTDGDEPIAGLDVGYRHPTAFIVIIYNQQKDYFHIVDEYLEAERNTKEHVEGKDGEAGFNKLIEKWNIETIFIDSAAAQFASDLAYIYNIATIKAKKDVLPGIAYVQTLLETGRLKISSHCTETLRAFDQYQWDTKEGLQKEKPVHTYSHIPDAVRYALYSYSI
jgi:Terminase large subunit, T4likevirus-type, N-terminal/Terminase RNaseH-like domain